jgi:hypothetical protein
MIVMLPLLAGILAILALGAILFWVIGKYVSNARLADILKLLVGMICFGAILSRLSGLLGNSP